MAKKSRWFEKYKRMNSALFLLENSGRYLNIPPPARRRAFQNPDIITESIAYDSRWSIVGWSLNTPFYPDYPSVGIMFEDTEGERFWWHFAID